MIDAELENSKSLDLNNLNYIRLKMLERISHAVDKGFVNISDCHLTKVRIDLKTLLEDIETEMSNRGMELNK